MSAQFRRVTIAIQAQLGAERENIEAYHLHDSSWAVAKRAWQYRNGAAWTVYHVPTGLLVRQGIRTATAARELAVTIRNAHPELPALAALPFGTAPSAETPEAKAEAVGILATIRAWAQEKEVTR